MLATPLIVLSVPALMEIVLVNVPGLLELDVLDAEEIYADNVTNRLIHRHVLSRGGETLCYKYFWRVPLQRFDNHLFAEIFFLHYLFYKTAQLEKRFNSSCIFQLGNCSLFLSEPLRKPLMPNYSRELRISSLNVSYARESKMRPCAFVNTLGTRICGLTHVSISILSICTAIQSFI